MFCPQCILLGLFGHVQSCSHCSSSRNGAKFCTSGTRPQPWVNPKSSKNHLEWNFTLNGGFFQSNLWWKVQPEVANCCPYPYQTRGVWAFELPVAYPRGVRLAPRGCRVITPHEIYIIGCLHTCSIFIFWARQHASRRFGCTELWPWHIVQLKQAGTGWHAVLSPHRTSTVKLFFFQILELFHFSRGTVFSCEVGTSINCAVFRQFLSDFCQRHLSHRPVIHNVRETNHLFVEKCLLQQSLPTLY